MSDTPTTRERATAALSQRLRASWDRTLAARRAAANAVDLGNASAVSSDGKGQHAEPDDDDDDPEAYVFLPSWIEEEYRDQLHPAPDAPWAQFSMAMRRRILAIWHGRSSWKAKKKMTPDEQPKVGKTMKPKNKTAARVPPRPAKPIAKAGSSTPRPRTWSDIALSNLSTDPRATTLTAAARRDAHAQLRACGYEVDADDDAIVELSTTGEAFSPEDAAAQRYKCPQGSLNGSQTVARLPLSAWALASAREQARLAGCRMSDAD